MTDLEERDKLMKKDIIYSAVIGRGRYWHKVYLEGMVGKYLANLNQNKSIWLM